MITLLEAATESGSKKIEVNELYRLLPFTPIPGGALSYDKPINALSEDPLNLNQLTLGVKRGVYP